MLDIQLTAVKKRIKPDEQKSQNAYAKLKKLKEKQSHMKAIYAAKGLAIPEIIA